MKTFRGIAYAIVFGLIYYLICLGYQATTPDEMTAAEAIGVIKGMVFPIALGFIVSWILPYHYEQDN